MSERSPRLRGLRPRTQLRSPHAQKVRSETSDCEEADDGAGRTRNNRNAKPARPASPRDESDEDELHIEIKDEQEEEASDDKSDGERNYECKTCKTPIGFPTLVEYLRHLRDEHKEKGRSYECPHCDFSCQHPKKLKAHCNSEHKNVEDAATSEELVSHRCTMCPYVANDSNELENHQRVHHLKRRFFRCTKCSYMTHVRARYTKHVKYHSMPMIKCIDCDFRTPYKWNLDRHTRNHGGGGTFQCRACNFTADIRQSLTVHETNHHEPPVGQSNKKLNTPFERKPRNGPKRYNQVGASDYRDLPHSASPSPVKTRSPVKSPTSDVGSSSLEERRNAIAGAECIALKCEEKGCQFITAWDSEMQRHLAESHAPPASPVRPRKPLPMLIPLSPENNTNSNSVTTIASNKSTATTATTLLKVPRVRVRPELAKIARDTEMAKLYGQRESGPTKKDVSGVDSFEKRNASFFDKLKERLMTTSANVAGGPQVAVSSANDLKCWCTFEASSPEELASHSQTHHAALSVSVGISRCPKCRRRCKSSDDLQMHMRICQTSINDTMTIDNYPENPTISTNYTGASYGADFEFPFQVDWDGSFGGLNSSGSSVEGVSGHPHGRRVFKCPHCPFWASTASRFHVHIVGHLNRKPFECSLCAYRSNWRWDITKHIKLKAARDPAHMTARVLMTDETGRRNYSKYNKYLAQIEQQGADESGLEEGPAGESRIDEPPKKTRRTTEPKEYSEGPPELTPAPGIDRTDTNSMSILTALNLRPPPPLKSAAQRSQGQSLLKNNPSGSATSVCPSVAPTAPIATVANVSGNDDTKRTLWKCKRCTFRDSNKETVLSHVKTHYDGLENSCTDGDKTDFTCPDCPYTSTDPTAMAIHRIHHRPNLEAIFKCYLCPYYVSTKAELLEHARLHGEELAVVHQRSVDSLAPPTKRKSPHRSFTENENSRKSEIAVEEIVDPIVRSTRVDETVDPDESATPMLLDTRALPDTPLVWVSRPDGTLAKMLKCRHCPHVSSRRAEVRDHETMHVDSGTSGNSVACPDCSFTCSRRDVMETHAEMHVGSLGTVHCLVDEARTDAQQLDDLTTLLGLARTPVLGPEPDVRDSRLVHCCSKCPARFLCDKELRIHLRYHSTELAYSCKWCSYAARQQAHLSAHQKAHSSEYQDRTRYLLSIYGHSQRYPPPNTACVESDDRRTIENSRNPTNERDRSSNVAWIVVDLGSSASQNFTSAADANDGKNSNQVFTCAKCPARYFRLDALEYHMTLHGSNNRFKCSECDYSSKTAQNLLKHQVVHRRHVETSETTAAPPPPPPPPSSQQQQQQPQQQQQHQPDPQYGTTSRGNPNFVYPGCVRNGRLKEKRYKCHKCPSAFEKREQYRVHLTLHGAKQRYRCDKCDYSVKYYANYTQHVKKHQANAQAQASRRRSENDGINSNGEIVGDKEVTDVRVSKNRRKSTISSTSVVNRDNAVASISAVTGIQQASNQDKQSIMLMRKKGIPIAISDANERIIRCQDCPFSGSDKDAMDAHRRRHGIERLTPSCPHCNYVPRKDENVGEHVRLHFTRLYKPESYLIVEMLSLTVRNIFNDKNDGKHKEPEILFRECPDGTYLPANETANQSVATTSNANGYQEKVVVDPNTVDLCASKYAPKN